MQTREEVSLVCIFYVTRPRARACTHTQTRTHTFTRTGKEAEKEDRKHQGGTGTGGGEMDKEHLSHTTPTSYQEGDPELEEQGVLILTEKSLKVQ